MEIYEETLYAAMKPFDWAPLNESLWGLLQQKYEEFARDRWPV